MEQIPWDKRIPGESVKAYDAFSIYRDMGVSRSLDSAWWSSTDAGKKGEEKGTKKAPGNWKKWSAQNKWRSRCKAYDDRQVEIKRKIKEEEGSGQYRIEVREDLQLRREKIKALRKEQWEMGCKLQELAKAGIKALSESPDKMSGADIVKTLQLSIELKKESLGVTKMPALEAIVTLADEGLLPPEIIEFFEEVVNEPIALISEKISELYIERLKNE
jgi:hypothetical protein